MYHCRIFTVSTFLINSSWRSSQGPACRPCIASFWSASSGTRCPSTAHTSTTENLQTVMLRISSDALKFDVWEQYHCIELASFFLIFSINWTMFVLWASPSCLGFFTPSPWVQWPVVLWAQPRVGIALLTNCSASGDIPLMSGSKSWDRIDITIVCYMCVFCIKDWHKDTILSCITTMSWWLTRLIEFLTVICPAF